MSYSRIHLFKNLGAAFLVLAGCLTAAGVPLRGTVTNGTSKKPAIGDDVVLIKLEKGMEEEARTKTRGNGTFILDVKDLNAPHLIRVRHENVNYLEPLKPGSDTVDVTVYNAAAKVEQIQLLDQSQVYEANEEALRVIEILRYSNTSSPPLTQPNFELTLPEGAKVQRAQAVAPSGMPIPATPAPESNNRYLVSYPLRPGVTQYELIYILPYQGSYKAVANIELPAEKFFVVTPKSMKFDGPAFHSDQWIEPNFDVDTHAVDHPTPGQEYAFEVAGMGRLPQTGNQEGNAAQRPGEDNRPGGGLGVPNERPNPLSSGTWAFLGVLTLFMAGGAVFLVMTSNGSTAAVVQPKAQSGSLLDALKEEMFQLEADRINGKVGTTEYNAAKGALDKTLQRAMKRKK